MAQLEEKDLKTYDEADEDWVAIYNHPVASPESSEESFTGVTWEKAKATKPWPTNIGKKKNQEQPGTSKQSVPPQDEAVEDPKNQVVQLGVRKYGCRICGTTCTKSANVVRHISMVHLKKKDEICPYCQRKFGTAFVLKRHLLQHGIGDLGAFECDICGKVFDVKYSIKQHMYIHGTDFPFKCKVCDKKFKFVSSLQRHKKLHKETVHHRN